MCLQSENRPQVKKGWSRHSTAPPAVSSCTERHPVVSVCSHGEKGHSEPAGAGGAGDIEPGVVSGERVRRGGRGGGGRRLHGHLSLCPRSGAVHVAAAVFVHAPSLPN